MQIGRPNSLYELLIREGFNNEDAIKPTLIPGLRYNKLQPRILQHLRLRLADIENRESALKKILITNTKEYDFILIDCPPCSRAFNNKQFGIASNSVIVPLAV